MFDEVLEEQRRRDMHKSKEAKEKELVRRFEASMKESNASSSKSQSKKVAGKSFLYVGDAKFAKMFTFHGAVTPPGLVKIGQTQCTAEVRRSTLLNDGFDVTMQIIYEFANEGGVNVAMKVEQLLLNHVFKHMVNENLDHHREYCTVPTDDRREFEETVHKWALHANGRRIDTNEESALTALSNEEDSDSD